MVIRHLYNLLIQCDYPDGSNTHLASSVVIAMLLTIFLTALGWFSDEDIFNISVIILFLQVDTNEIKKNRKLELLYLCPNFRM